MLCLLSFGIKIFPQVDSLNYNLPDNFDESDNKILLRKEWSIGVIASSKGVGMGYRYGKHVTGYKKRMLEAEINTMKHPKEIKTISPFENAKSYVYGKLNNLFIIRTGIGIQKIINNKPIEGGIEVRYFYYGGINLSITKPIYLYILNFSPSSSSTYIYTLEKYNPNEHFTDNIFGRGPFIKGFNELSFYPGLYIKGGINFEYSQDDKNLNVLEMGICTDFSPKPIKMMAFNKSNNYFISLYLSLNFGKRNL